MTVLSVVGTIVMFFLFPYLVGNIYGFIFRKKTMGIVTTYFSGMAVVYAMLTALQMIVVKFKFDFWGVGKIYGACGTLCICIGIVCWFFRCWKDKAFCWEIKFTKRSLWVVVLILLQGVLYIVLKNPYFEDNALLETARVTLQTGTIYQYNAFTGMEAVAGFPLANKLMFLPMLYAYVGKISGIDLALLFNFVMPVVTFASFYLLMILWVQKLDAEYKIRWEGMLFLLVWLLQVGDGWNRSIAFKVLHSGYTGEAIFFGVLFVYAIYKLKNKSYLMTVVCCMSFPGLVKYDAVLEFVRAFGQYKQEAAFYSSMFLLYLLSAIFLLIKNKKIITEILNPNLTIMLFSAMVSKKLMEMESKRGKKIFNVGVILLLLLLCGNIKLISDVTEWRSNPYGADKSEYELLKLMESDCFTEGTKVASCDEVLKWIKRLDVNVEPVIGYDLGGNSIWWYSYEEYNVTKEMLWKNLNDTSVDSEQEFMGLKDVIEMDYIVIERITELIPMQKNQDIKCVYDSPLYLVYSVDKD